VEKRAKEELGKNIWEWKTATTDIFFIWNSTNSQEFQVFTLSICFRRVIIIF
jgi:hypothetical protein